MHEIVQCADCGLYIFEQEGAATYKCPSCGASFFVIIAKKARVKKAKPINTRGKPN